SKSCSRCVAWLRVVANSFVNFLALRRCQANAGTASPSRSSRNPPRRPTRSLAVVPFRWSMSAYFRVVVSTPNGAKPLKVRAVELVAGQEPSAAITTAAPQHELLERGLGGSELARETTARRVAPQKRCRIACLIVHGSPSRTPLRRLNPPHTVPRANGTTT